MQCGACLENTLLEKCIKNAGLTGYGPMKLLVMGYYMKQCQIPIQASGIE